jgi:hypothetical protein
LEFSRYCRDGAQVVYDGIHFQAGDLLVADLNEKVNGLYSGITEPRSYAAHFGMFVLLKRNGIEFPSVVEISEAGVRAVPLSTFLSPRYVRYVEVFRITNLTSEDSERLNQAALTAISEPHGYSFYTGDPNQKYLTCAEVGALLMKKAGLEPIEPQTRFLDAADPNLAALGLPNRTFLSPTDYVTSDRVQFVGVVDHQNWVESIANELLVSRFRHYMTTEPIHLERLPTEYWVNLWEIHQIEKKTPIGYLFMRLEGFSTSNFPDGPEQLIAAINPIGEEIEKEEKPLRVILHSRLDPEAPISLHDLESTGDLPSLADQGLSLFIRLFGN